MLARRQLFDGHFNGEMNEEMITGDSWAATVYAIGSCISHMDTHTHTHTLVLAVVHRKHMVKLIGLTWQRPQ